MKVYARILSTAALTLYDCDRMSDHLEQLTQLAELTGVKPDFESRRDDIFGLYAACLKEGPAYRHKLDKLVQVTGIQPNDTFIKQHLLGNDAFSTPVSITISPQLLDAHFQDPKHRTLSEYQRIYNIFSCYSYYQETLAKLERSGNPESRPDEIALLAVMALRDKNNASQYQYTKEKLMSLARPGNTDITQALGAAFAALIHHGDAELLTQFTSYLYEKSKSQDIALSTFLQVDHPTSNKCLLTLLNITSVSSDVKVTILKNLLNNKSGFIPEHVRAWAHAIVNIKGMPFPWEDLQYFQELLKIPSADLRSKSLKCLNTVFKFFHEKGISPTKVHTEQYSSIPTNVFLALWEFTESNTHLLTKFNALYKTITSSREKDELLFAIINALSIHPDVLKKINENLAEIKLASAGTSTQLCSVLKYACFLDMVFNIGQLHSTETLDCLDISHQTLTDLAQTLKKIATGTIRTILPREGITADSIQTLLQHWGDLDPIFIYASRMAGHDPETLDFFAEMVEHMDPPIYKQWKTWRYNLQNRTVEQQIGQLNSGRLELWKKDSFVEFSTIMVAATPRNKPQQIRGRIAEALKEGHIYHPDITPVSQHKFIQEQLGTTYIAILEQPDACEALLNQKIESLRTDLDKIDALIRFSDLKKLKQAAILFASDKIPANTKTKDILDCLKHYLPDYQESLKNTPALVRKSLQDKINTIEQEYQTALNSDIFKRYGLNREQIQNVGQFHQKRTELRALFDLYRISALDVTQIANNQVSGETLTTVLNRLSKYFKDTAFAQDIQNIQSLVTQKKDLGGNRRLAMIVTDNPQMLLQIGKYPIGCGSCQNFEGSSEWNQALGGYVGDAHTKGCFLIDLNKLPENIQADIATNGFDSTKWNIPPQYLLEASIARTITKLLMHVSTKQPVLFIEPTYSSLNKTDLSMDKCFNLFLKLILSGPMGIRLMRGAGTTATEMVRVAKSRNPGGQYEDCAAGNAGNAGMSIQNENYTMPARFINKFTPVSEADRELARRISQGSHA